MRIAIVGAGRRGKAHGRPAAAYPGAAVVAVCDPDTARATALATELEATAFPDHRQALEEARPDVVYLTSPPQVHQEQALDALRAGCALMIEKPVALDMEAVAVVGRAADEAGKLVVVCQQHRYSAAATRARELLEGRSVGLFHSYLYRQKPDIRGNWHRSWGGGHVVENQIHPIDLARYLIGEVRSVYARYADHVLAGTEDWDNWDSYSVTLGFEGGAVGSVATTYAAFPRIPQSSAIDIVADGLVLRYHWGRLEVFYPEGETESVVVEEEPTAVIGRAFLDAVQTGDRSALRQDYADAGRSLATCLAANESATTGRVITF